MKKAIFVTTIFGLFQISFLLAAFFAAQIGALVGLVNSPNSLLPPIAEGFVYFWLAPYLTLFCFRVLEHAGTFQELVQKFESNFRNSFFARNSLQRFMGLGGMANLGNIAESSVDAPKTTLQSIFLQFPVSMIVSLPFWVLITALITRSSPFIYFSMGGLIIGLIYFSGLAMILALANVENIGRPVRSDVHTNYSFTRRPLLQAMFTAICKAAKEPIAKQIRNEWTLTILALWLWLVLSF